MSLTSLAKLLETLQIDISQSSFEDCPILGNSEAISKNCMEVPMTPTPQTLTFHFPQALRTESIEGSDPVFAADNTASIQRSTTAGQIGIEVEELLAADDALSVWS